MSELATRDDFDRLGQSVQELASTLVTSVDAQTKVMNDLVVAMTEQRHVESARATGGHVDMHFNAGGIALWVSASCCALMLAALVPIALALYWVAMDSRDRGHQMNALCQSTPGLRELVDRQMRLID